MSEAEPAKPDVDPNALTDDEYRRRVQAARLTVEESQARLAQLDVAEKTMRVKVRADTAKRIEEANDLTRSIVTSDSG